jgi:IS30 family transposase
MVYAHITKEQRFKIQSWRELSMSQSEMADRLGKNKSAISRELGLNSFADGHYEAQHADKLQRQRRRAGKRTTKKLIKDKKLLRAVIRKLKLKDSPEQIAGRRKYLKKDYVVHETLYSYIYTEAPELKIYLRQKKGRYRRRHGTQSRENKREQAKKRRIDERPMVVELRTEIGHWEGDTIRGKEKTTGIATHVERVSGFGLGDKLDHVTALNLKQKTVQSFARVPREKKKTETLDNGIEFSEYELMEKETGIAIYFAYPYHSWERGSNENFNGLLRQFFPKGSSFATVTQKDVDRAIRNLNHRPRKRLGYLTPYEVFVKGLLPSKVALHFGK